ncbi:MAG: sulfatase [Bacteroidales bacterium]
MNQPSLSNAAMLFPALLAGCAGQVKNDQEPARPNIIFILSDDHDRQAISAYGGNLNKTPNIDRLAREGMLFRNCFVTNSISGPSRAVLLTGKHSHMNGFRQNEAERFDSSQMTFPKLFREAGYQTAIVGKWHLESQPMGFDYWNILPGQGSYYNPDFIDNGNKVRIPGYVTDITMDLALQWMNSRQQDRPFMLMIHNKAPHRNWEPALRDLELYDSTDIPEPGTLFDDYTGRGRAAREQEMTILNHMWPVGDLKVQPEVAEKLAIPGWRINPEKTYEAVTGRMSQEEKARFTAHYRKRDSLLLVQNPKGKEMLRWKYQQYIKDYLRCIHAVDDNVGRLLHYLDSTGLSKNTIVVYASDQGFYLGNHGWFDKRFMYEESMSTPFIVRWPGVTTGDECDAMVQNLDWAETLLDMAKIDIPRDMQGLSLTSLLRQEKNELNRDELYYHYYEFPLWHHVYPHLGIRTKDYKLMYFYTINEWEFYDLKNDPNEMQNGMNNLVYKWEIESMKQRLVKAAERYGDEEAVKVFPEEAN